MSKESWKVFVACALGAGTGSLVALELNQWLWWVGLIVGGLIGYLSYEFKEVLAAIQVVWKEAVHPSLPLRIFGWKVELWLSFSLLAIFLLFLVLGFFIFETINQALMSVPLWLVTGILGLIAGVVPFPDVLSTFADGKTDEEKLAQMRIIARAVFPPIVIFWHLPRGLAWLTYTLTKFIARFSWQVFIRIHSEMRLLCMADAALGATVGYLVGSAIIGTLAGGVFGLVNYAVVTKRILEPRGLLPAR